MLPQVDRTALRFNQACIVGIVGLGFILGSVWLIALVAVALAVGTVWPALAPFKGFYARVLRPAGLLRPDVAPDDPAQHRFAQGVGATFLAGATVLLALGVTVLGWLLAGIVLVLALINLSVGFCAGCFVYYQLGRLGLMPGRAARPTEGRP